MGLTSIGNQLTPGTPEEITFAAAQGLPSANQALIILGHVGVPSASGTVPALVPQVISNVADPVAASGEASGYFGAASEIVKMVVAAVRANAEGGTFPAIKCVGLPNAATDWSTALDVIDRLPGEYVVSPYQANDQTLMGLLLNECAAMSSPQRVDNGQYGTLAVAVNQSVATPSGLFKYDKTYGSFHWLRDSAPVLSVGEIAASVAAQLAANAIPFKPLRNQVLPNVPAPASQLDWISVGAGMESEVALQQGWSPLRVLPNGDVAHVRTRLLRVTTGDGVTALTAYFDVQDFNVLFFWRKTLATRYAQPDIAQAKASGAEATLILGELIRLGNLFEEQGMFQAMALLAKQFVVQRNISDRSRFDVFTPVNVIPILAVVATNIQATTVGDTLTV